MTRAELTDESRWTLPYPGAPRMDNCIATMLMHGNSSRNMTDKGKDTVAAAQGFDAAEFRARFAHLETAFEAELSRQSQQPSNSFEQHEGK